LLPWELTLRPLLLSSEGRWAMGMMEAMEEATVGERAEDRRRPTLWALWALGTLADEPSVRELRWLRCRSWPLGKGAAMELLRRDAGAGATAVEGEGAEVKVLR
jgi:hypothetical protein